MLKVTKSAWNRLSKLQSSRPEIRVLRLTCKDGAVKCRRGVLRSDDHVLASEGHPDLLIAPTLAAKLSEQTLHAPKTGHGRRLRLKRKP